MLTDRRPALSVVLTITLALVTAACSGAGSSGLPDGSAGASDAPGATPVGGIEHPTGADEVILRYEEGGGFVPAGFFATETPHFTLYGDGTVVFRNPAAEPPPPVGSVFLMNPHRTATLDADQIQELLAFALGEGGLAAARPEYTNDMVADASTAVFTIDAGGIKKRVSVYALGLDLPEEGAGADAPARAAFSKLAARLNDFDQGGTIPTDVYVPTAYRGVLFESPGIVAPDVREWPWPDLTPADFVMGDDANARPFPSRTMAPAEIDVLGIEDYEGGFQGMVIAGPDGKMYTFSLRPLLPGETD
jgi:hypothetical protein